MEEKSKKYGNSTTRKLKDGAVTMEKLAEDVKEELNLAMVPVVKVESDTVALEVNKLYLIRIPDKSLTIEIGSLPTDETVSNVYQCCFYAPTADTTVTFPPDMYWAETPTIEENKFYEVSIRYIEGVLLGLISGWTID